MMNQKKILPPPWLAYPKIERYSIGWRMGYGEDYIMKWGSWYDSLTNEEKMEYQTLFPEPVTWRGYWKHDEAKEEEEGFYYAHEEFFIEYWQKNGIPKYSLEKLQREYHSGKKLDFCMFWGHQPSSDGSITKSCLSQWWMSDFWSVCNTYCCMEQYMMDSKAELFGDEDIHKKILENNIPKEIKALGRKVKNFDGKIWDEVKYSIVLNGNYKKFSQNTELKKFLLSTGDSILVETSPYDAVWGIKMSANDEASANPLKWKGSNLLGFALMEVRDELRRISENEHLCVEI